MAARTERHSSVDRGTTLGMRFDCKRSVHHFHSLVHADEAKPRARLCRFLVKPCAGILNREMNLIRRSPQSHFKVSYSTVFRRIVEGFLQNSEEAQRNVRRQVARQIVDVEVNLNFLLLGELLAEASDGSSNTQVLQFCRVQLV